MKTKLALSAFAVAFLLSACGSKTEAPAPAADTTPPPAAAADSAASDAAAAASAAAEAASSAASAAKQYSGSIADPHARAGGQLARSSGLCFLKCWGSGFVANQYSRLQTLEEGSPLDPKCLRRIYGIIGRSEHWAIFRPRRRHSSRGRNLRQLVFQRSR